MGGRRDYADRQTQLEYCDKQTLFECRQMAPEGGNQRTQPWKQGFRVNNMRQSLKEIWTEDAPHAVRSSIDLVINSLLRQVDLQNQQDFIEQLLAEQCSPMEVVICTKNAEAMECLLRGVDSDSKYRLLATVNRHGYTPLHEAARCTNPWFIQSLRDELEMRQWQQLLTLTDAYQCSPLHVAASSNESTRVMRTLLDRIDAETRMNFLLERDINTYTVLHLVATFNNGPIISEILHPLNESQTIELLSAKNGVDRSPLHVAVREKREADVIAAMIGQLSMENRTSLIISPDSNGQNALHLAALHNCQVIECLIDMLDISRIVGLLTTEDKKGCTPLHLTAERGNSGGISALIGCLDLMQKLQLLNSRDCYSWTPVHAAMKNRNDPTVIDIMLNGVSESQRMHLIMREDSSQQTPVHIAARHGSSETIGRLLDGIDSVDKLRLLVSPNVAGRTPMHLALDYNSLEVACCLVEAFDPADKVKVLRGGDACPLTPFHIAVNHCDANVLQHLWSGLEAEQRMALLSAKNTDGWTPMHVAARYNQHSRVLFVLMEQLSDAEKLILLQMRISNASGDTVAHLIMRFSRSPENIEEVLTAVSNDYDLLDILLDENDMGDNCLHLIVRYQRVELAEYALKKLQRLNFTPLLTRKNKQNMTPIDICVSTDSKDLLESLAFEYEHSLYHLSAPARVIIFATTTEREGAVEEVEALMTVLSQFDVQIDFHKDTTSAELLYAIQAAQQADTSALVVFIMSHGYSGHVRAADRMIELSEILSAMCGPLLNGKPKALIVQACQVHRSVSGLYDIGENSDAKGRSANSLPLRSSRGSSGSSAYASMSQPGSLSLTPPTSTSTNVSLTPPTMMNRSLSLTNEHTDLLLYFATLDGGLAERNLMIPCLADNLKKYRGDMNDCLLGTSRQVTRASSHQIPEQRMTMIRHFRLKLIDGGHYS